MSQRANPLAVGLFFAVAVALLLGSLFFFGAKDLFRQTERFVVYFEGSITGLKVGAPVTFQGVQVGRVADIRLSMSGDSDTIIIPVLIDIDRHQFTEFVDNGHGLREKMIARGLRAQLKLQSVLTSLLLVELDFYPGTPVTWRGPPDGDYPELPTVPTPLQELMRTVDTVTLTELLHSTRKAVNGIEALVNHPDTKASVTALRQLLQHADEAVVRFDRDVVPALQALRRTLDEVAVVTADVRQDYPQLHDDLAKALAASRQAAEHFDQVAQEARFVLSEDSALYRDLQQAAQEVSQASRSVRELSDTLNEQPQSLLHGKPVPPKED